MSPYIPSINNFLLYSSIDYGLDKKIQNYCKNFLNKIRLIHKNKGNKQNLVNFEQITITSNFWIYIY